MIDYDKVRKILKEIEPEASGSLGDLGCHMIENAIDVISERLHLTEEEVEELSKKLAVGVIFEIEEFDDKTTQS